MVTIADEHFVFGSIKRKMFVDYNKRFLYRYRDVVADLTGGNKYVNDGLFDNLLRDNIIDQTAHSLYYNALKDLFSMLPDRLDVTDESFYAEILKIRAGFFTEEAKQYLNANSTCQLQSNRYGIDQRCLLKNETDKSEALFIFIDECKYLDILLKFYNEVKHKHITIVINGAEIFDYSNRKKMADRLKGYNVLFDDHEGIGFDLSKYEITNQTLVIGFGEWFLGAFKDLNCNSFVCCTSIEILSRGLTNASIRDELHFIYVPRLFNILKDFNIVEKSFFNYRVYDWLYKDYGISIFDIPKETLLEKYPSYFISHDSDRHVPFDDIKMEDDFSQSRVSHINKQIQHKNNQLVLDQLTYYDQNKDPIKVNYLKLDSSMKYDIDVLSYSTSKDIRSLFRSQRIKRGIITNFLFFTTDKTINTYNRLRQDRPDEMYKSSGWHMDYQKKDHEAFPLFNKAMIALNHEGDIAFKRMTLKEGQIKINGKIIKWYEPQINTDDELNFKIFTPMYYKNQSKCYLEDSHLIGTNRINMVIINNEVVVVKNGEVMLPSIGVVLSFEESYFNELFEESSQWTIDLTLDDEYQWAYGGGMFLIHNNEAFDTKLKLEEEFLREGWLYNLSKQTQDSETFKLDKHPRTAIGQTAEGDLFIIVCAGRSKYSVGADYFDLIKISRSLFGDVKHLMNLDGGASSLMGAVIDSEVLVLNDITFTNDSCSGMLRPLNSLISIRLY